MKKDTAVGTYEDGYRCLLAAIREIECRLESGDFESSLSMAKAAQIVVKKGMDSPELVAFHAIEQARLSV